MKSMRIFLLLLSIMIAELAFMGYWRYRWPLHCPEGQIELQHYDDRYPIGMRWWAECFTEAEWKKVKSGETFDVVPSPPLPGA